MLIVMKRAPTRPVIFAHRLKMRIVPKMEYIEVKLADIPY
jgi:hypothetical protein